MPDVNMKISEYNQRKKKLLESIDLESAKVQEETDKLSLFSLKLKYTTLILVLAFFVLVLLFIYSPTYFFIYWLVSSFVFLMVNPFIFLIPTGRGRGIDSKKDKEFSASGIYGDVKSSMKVIKKEKKLFVEFGWKLFFINCQPLAPGFIGIFVVCILFGSLLFTNNIFDRFTFATIVVQCFAIIVFYAGIWFVKPHSEEFLGNMLGLKVRAKEKYHSGVKTFFKYIFIVVVFAAVGGIVMLLALLLPGFTLGRILQDGSEIEFKIMLFAMIFVSQVILVRYIQGGSSRTIVGSFLRLKQEFLENLRKNLYSARPPSGGPDEVVDLENEEILHTSEKSALEMNLFMTAYHNFAGYFPV